MAHGSSKEATELARLFPKFPCGPKLEAFTVLVRVFFSSFLGRTADGDVQGSDGDSRDDTLNMQPSSPHPRQNGRENKGRVEDIEEAGSVERREAVLKRKIDDGSSGGEDMPTGAKK